MKYQAYQEYKDSGVEWLGDVPKHWFASKIKYGYDITLGKMLQKEAKTSEDRLKPYLKAVNIQPDGVSINDVGTMWFSPRDLNSLVLVDGDVLISEGGDVGRAAIWRNELPECYIQNAINRARPKLGRCSGYLFYWVSMLKNSKYIDILCNKATIAHYTAEKVETSPLFMPLNHEAVTIANFLDHETAKIDALIEKQQQLIKLLKEKRQAVISHAVTKGLNPDAPMRDSGVEWLGEVPAHWVCCPMKYQALVIDCKHITAEFADEGIPLASIGEVKEWKVNLTTAKLTSKKFYLELIEGNRKPKAGDIIYSRNATVGEAALVTNDMPIFAMGQDVCLIRFKQSVLSEYILFVLKSGVIRQQLDLAMVGSTFKRINVDDIRNFLVAIPTYNEQCAITNELKRIISKYDTSVSSAEIIIKLLKERRTALISAAVTGKIDVRDWQPPTA
jgi:type I restriction enzyme S subunit